MLFLAILRLLSEAAKRQRKGPSVIHVRLSVSVIIASDNVPHAPQMGDKRSEMNGFCDPYASGTRMKISF